MNQFPAAWGKLDSKAVVLHADYSINANVSAFAGIGTRKHDYSGFINGTHVRSIDATGTGTSPSTLTVASRGYDDSASAEAGLRWNFNTRAVAHEVVLQATRLKMERAL